MGASRRLAILAPAGLLALTSIGVFAAPSFGAVPTIVVNQAGNQVDSDGGAGECDVNAAAGSQCTLRAAIETANATPEQDIIGFSFDGSAPVTINVPTALPTITHPLVIDGYSVADASVNTAVTGTNAKLRIVLNGPGSGAVNGLDIAAPSDISGLVIQDFEEGIFIAPGGDGSVIWGNFIGTAASGLAKAANDGAGVHVDCLAAVTIGGSTRAARNILSANNTGIILCEDVRGTRIQGNLIGVGADAVKDLGNHYAGIQTLGTRGAVIGGDAVAARNVIARNSVGILVAGYQGIQPHGIQVLGNSIFANSGLGIDLSGDGITPNDGAGDPDGGANDRQNFPRITSAVTRNGDTVIKGQLVTTETRSFTVRIFVSTSGNEGAKLLMKLTLSTDDRGKVTFSRKAPVRVAVGRMVTATATDNVLDQTSEFSAARAVTD